MPLFEFHSIPFHSNLSQRKNILLDLCLGFLLTPPHISLYKNHHSQHLLLTPKKIGGKSHVFSFSIHFWFIFSKPLPIPKKTSKGASGGTGCLQCHGSSQHWSPRQRCGWDSGWESLMGAMRNIHQGGLNHRVFFSNGLAYSQGLVPNIFIGGNPPREMWE